MIELLERTARTAGNTVLSYFHKESHITQKTSHQNLVTKADTASQEVIRRSIVSELGLQGIAEHEVGFIGEENLKIQGVKHLFIIDPLDGTNNFASGLDYFCVSIAHVEDGKLKDAIIYWASRDIVYCASIGKGAFKRENGRTVQLSVKEELLSNSVVFTHFSSHQKYREMALSLFEKILDKLRGIRIFGSLCLDLAHLSDTTNSAHIVANFHAYLWDIAAGALIVKESGGGLYDLSGNELVIRLTDADSQYSFIAAHPTTMKELKKYI